MESFDAEITAILNGIEIETEAEEEPIIEDNIVEEEIIEDDVLIENVTIKTPIFKIGDVVKLVPEATYISGNAIPNNLFNSKLYIRTIKNDNYGIGIKTVGRISGVVNGKYLVSYADSMKEVIEPENHYLVLIKADELNIKSRPDNSSKTLKTVHRNGLFTVIGEKNGWYHLKIGGWVPMESVKKIEIKK